MVSIRGTSHDTNVGVERRPPPFGDAHQVQAVDESGQTG